MERLKQSGMVRISVDVPVDDLAALTRGIADAVVAQLKPMLSGLETKPQQAGGMMGVVRFGAKGVGAGSNAKGREEPDRQSLSHGFLRLRDVLAIVPVSRSTWYKGIGDGRYPKPTKRFGPRIVAWDIRDVLPLLKQGDD
jgi:predicted DNA-binding transcriptional regulator AlpA